MNTQIMKRLFTLSALSISLLSASVVYAAVPSPTAAQEAEMIKQLKNLNQNVQVVGNRVQASAEAAIKSKYSLSGNSSITTSAMGNIAYQQNKDANSQNTVAATNADITTQLQPLSDKILETSGGMMDSDEISNRLINDMRLKKSLSIDIPGSDTPYSNNPLVVQLAALYPKSFPSWGLAKQDPQNGSFDFSSIIQPTAYAPGTAKEIAAGIAPAQQAQTTLAFLTTSYVNASNGLDLDTFQAKVAAASTKDKVSLYMQLMNDPKYQDYLLSARTSVAQRSVAMNNFEHIISERTPVKDLGTKAGIPGVKDASPLQIQEYLATRRVSSPQWFTSVQSASATSVQRQTLIVLAEIEAQNFQAHLDSERMLATMSAQTAMSGSLSANLALSKANQLNQDFKGYTTSSNQTSNSKQNKEAQQQRAQEAANKAGANN